MKYSLCKHDIIMNKSRAVIITWRTVRNLNIDPRPHSSPGDSRATSPLTAIILHTLKFQALLAIFNSYLQFISLIAGRPRNDEQTSR